MDHDFEMQPHGAPGPRNSSRSHLLGRPTCPSKLPGGVSPLIPVLRKTFHLDAFSPSHIPQASSRPGLGARAWSVSSQETGKSLASRKFSSISLTVHPHSQARPLGPLPSHWEELSSPGREAATHGGGRLPTAGLSSVTLVPGDRVHSEGPGNPGLAKSSRLPTAEKPLVSSYLTLPFQSRLAPSPPGPVGPGSVGPRHPVPVTAHVPARASPGRGKPRSRGIPRPRLHLQRASPTTGPVMAMDLAALDTKPRTASRLSTRTTNIQSPKGLVADQAAKEVATQRSPTVGPESSFTVLMEPELPLRPLRGLQETRVATREESGVLGFPSQAQQRIPKQ